MSVPVRKPNGHFVPGQSGNPTGRPKGFASLVRARFGRNGEQLVDFLASVLDGTAEADEVIITKDSGPVPVKVGPTMHEKLEAWKLAAAYGFGRPALAVELSGPEGGPIEIGRAGPDFERMSEADLLAYEQSLRTLSALKRKALPEASGEFVDGEVVDASET